MMGEMLTNSELLILIGRLCALSELPRSNLDHIQSVGRNLKRGVRPTAKERDELYRLEKVFLLKQPLRKK